MGSELGLFFPSNEDGNATPMRLNVVNFESGTHFTLPHPCLSGCTFAWIVTKPSLPWRVLVGLLKGGPMQQIRHSVNFVSWLRCISSSSAFSRAVLRHEAVEKLLEAKSVLRVSSVAMEVVDMVILVRLQDL